MDNKQVFIHIGFGKTGTSSIQAYLFHNSKHDNVHYLYPKTGLKGSGHHDLAELNTSNFSKQQGKLYSDLTQEIREDNTTDKIIISSEYFCFVKPEYIHNIFQYLKNFDVKIIFYIRKQNTLIQSSYLQSQKVGWDYAGSIENYFKLHAKSFDFVERISPWAEYFGSQNIIARLYDKKVIGNDICMDFMRIMKIEPGPDSINTNLRANSSLIPEFSEIISLLDNESLGSTKREEYIDLFLQLSNQFRKLSGTSLISSKLNKYIHQYYAGSNSEFAKCYLDDEQEKLLLNLC